MAWIKTISEEEATGDLRRHYEAAIKRAGRVSNILKIMSLNPEALGASMRLYATVCHGPSPLSRGVREMLAVVVSQLNRCHY